MNDRTVTPKWRLTRVSQQDDDDLKLTCVGQTESALEITTDGKTTLNTSLTVKGPLALSQPISGSGGPVKVADELSVTGAVKVAGGLTVTGPVEVPGGIAGPGAVPKGAILMWSGDPAKLPEGWYLCNGSGWLANGDPVPDLRGSFIVGHDPDNHDYRSVHNRGGAASVTLKGENLPKDEVMNLMEFVASRPLIEGSSHALSFDTGTRIKSSSKADSKPFDVRPPWYALAYIIYGGQGSNIYTDGNMRPMLRIEQFLSEGQYLASPSGRYVLKMMAGGTLRLLDLQDKAHPKTLWSAKDGAADAVGAKVYMQGDGNFVLYAQDRRVAFSSATYSADADRKGVRVRVTDAGKVTIDRADGSSVWSRP